MKFSLFYLPTVGNRQEIESGMLPGQNREIYQRFLHDLTEQAQLADELGFESIMFTEHHFHIEGFETSTNPLLLGMYLGMQTKRIRVGQAGLLLVTHNPIRLAEDIALVDHFLKGRLDVGFARGYQWRAVNTLGQQIGVGGTLSDKSEQDLKNREVFEEHFKILKLALTSEVFRYQGKYWQIPPPNIPWKVGPSEQYGKGASNGVVQAIGIAPRPYQQPHPPFFQAFSQSGATIHWTAEQDITPIMISTDPEWTVEMERIYQRTAAEHGRTLALGEGMAHARSFLTLDTKEEAFSLAESAQGWLWPLWFHPFGFFDAFKRRGEPTPEASYRPMVESGFEACVGDVETVTRNLEQLEKEFNVKHLLLLVTNELTPHDKVMRSIELFGTKVLPKFAD